MFQSRVYFLYRQCGIEQPADVKAWVRLYCKGLKRKGRKMVQDIGMGVMEGNKTTTLQVYKHLYIYILK